MCSRAVAAADLLVLGASKPTLGKDLIICIPHNVAGLLSSKRAHGYQNAAETRYQTKPGTCTKELRGKLFITPAGWWEDQFQITSPKAALGFRYTGFVSRNYKSQ